MASILLQFEEMSYGESKQNSNIGMEWLTRKHFGPYIHGAWEPLEKDDKDSTIINCLGVDVRVDCASSAKVNKAVHSCLENQEMWQKKGSDREVYLLKLVNLLETNTALLAQVEAINRGTLLKDTMALDVPCLISWFKYYASWAFIDAVDYSDWEPHGVVAVIVNKNTPLIALGWLLAPALAAGNCVCLCVPSETSLSAMLLAELFDKAGFPKGVLNVIPASKKTVESLITNTNIQNVRAFGSTSVVRELKSKLIFDPRIKTLAVMSARTPMLVFDSSDLDSAVESVVRSAWQNQGSLPWALKLLLVQESVFKLFVEKLKLRLKSLRIGCPFDKLADIGKPYDQNVVKDVAKVTALAAANGLEVHQAKLSAKESSLEFFPPTLLIGGEFVSNQVIESQEYPPVVSVIPFRTAKEAVTMANNSRYGMAVSVWTNKMTLAMDVSDLLQFGTVWINCHGVVDPSVPFQGWKESGIGDFGGKIGYLDCLKQQLQYNIPKTLQDENAFPDIKLKLSAEYDTEICYKLYHSGGYKNADGDAARSIIVKNKTLLTFSEANRKDVSKAVGAAASAFAKWSSNANARAQLLKNISQKIDANLKKITSVVTFSQKDSTDPEFSNMVKYTSQAFKYWGSVCDKVNQIRVQKPGFMVNTSREPLGVVALGIYSDLGLETCICHAATWQLAAALALGNPVLVVVDMKNASGILELLKAICEAGIPSGILSVLIGDSNIVMKTLAEHQSVSSIFHWNYPLELVKEIELAALKDMKVVRPCIIEDNVKPITREFTEMSVTRSKAVWVSKGEIFAN